jgi:transcriptional regulator with XRE-family HTH domain
MGGKRDLDKSALALFAEELRAQREQAGWSRDELAVKISYSPSLVSMIESGHRAPSPDFARKCDSAFKSPGTFARQEKRLRDIPFSSGFRPFRPYEDIAVVLRLFEHSLVPGLFQTEAYARSLLERHPNTAPEVVDKWIQDRLARQMILDRDEPPLVWALLDEQVLYREVGGPKTTHDQLVQVTRLASRPNITVQVIPSTSVHVGLNGAFAVADVPGTGPVAYLETAHDGQTMEDPTTGALMIARFDALRTDAHTGNASLELIEKAIEEKWRN